MCVNCKWTSEKKKKRLKRNRKEFNDKVYLNFLNQEKIVESRHHVTWGRLYYLA